MKNINRAYVAKQTFAIKLSVVAQAIENITQKKLDRKTRTFLLDAFSRIPDSWIVRSTNKNTIMIEAYVSIDNVSIDGEIINVTCVLPHQRLTPEYQSPTELAHYIMMLVFREAIEHYLRMTK